MNNVQEHSIWSQLSKPQQLYLVGIHQDPTPCSSPALKKLPEDKFVDINPVIGSVFMSFRRCKRPGEQSGVVSSLTLFVPSGKREMRSRRRRRTQVYFLPSSVGKTCHSPKNIWTFSVPPINSQVNELQTRLPSSNERCSYSFVESVYTHVHNSLAFK